MTRKILALSALAALFPVPAHATVAGDMQAFWAALDGGANVTGPQVFQGQAAGYYTLGNLYARAPSRNSQIATLSLPSFRAGCGGIDSFAGAFSFINADEFVALAKAVAANASGFAFQLAVETLSPVVAETMGQLREIARQVNLSNVNSCETAQALVGGLWPRSDRASASICAAVGNSQGIFSDYAAGRHGCGPGGRRASTLDAADSELKEQIPVDKNYAWEATRKLGFLASDDELAEFFMSLTGTLIVVGPNGDNKPVQRRILQPLYEDPNFVAALLRNGGRVPIYRCDTGTGGSISKCLNPASRWVRIAASDTFVKRVETLLSQLLTSVQEDTPAPPAAVKLVNATSLPVYKAINIYSAYNGSFADTEILAMSEAIALDILYLYLTESVREMFKAASALSVAGDDLDLWREELRTIRTTLRRLRGQGQQRFSEALRTVNNIRTIEQVLASTLSGEVRRGLDWEESRGNGRSGQ